MLWVKSYINVYIYIYIRTYKIYKMTKGWANSNKYMSIKVCSKLRNAIQWGFPPIQLLNDLAVTNRHIMKDLDGCPWRNCMFLIGMYTKLHEYTYTELSMETYPPRIWDHQCLFSHPRAPQQLLGDLRWDPQSKQKASNRKCRQKEVKLPKSTGEMIHKERRNLSFSWGNVFFCYPALHLHGNDGNGLQAPFASVVSQPWITRG